MALAWVYSKLERNASVDEYLARHTHRISITDARIVWADADSMTLRYKDCADHDCTRP